MLLSKLGALDASQGAENRTAQTPSKAPDPLPETDNRTKQPTPGKGPDPPKETDTGTKQPNPSGAHSTAGERPSSAGVSSSGSLQPPSESGSGGEGEGPASSSCFTASGVETGSGRRKRWLLRAPSGEEAQKWLHAFAVRACPALLHQHFSCRVSPVATSTDVFAVRACLA